MKGVAIIAAAAALIGGVGASASPDSLEPSLSFSIAAGVSDSGFAPLGGGICLGNRRVTDPKADGGIAWSPDGSRVAFYRQTGVLTADVFVADADGSHLRNLSRGSAGFSWAPTWSPDGTRIAYVASDAAQDQLMTVRPDGSAREPLPGTAYDPNSQLGSPAWSPDGQWIGYSLNDGIHLIRPDGSDPRLLLANAFGLAWSPDGSRIAFTRDADLAIAKSDGSGVRFVTRTPNSLEGAAAWSPDGSQLVYESVGIAPRGEPDPGDHMYLADGNGLDRREIHGPLGSWGPAWRPAAAPVRTRRCVVLGTRHADSIVGTSKGDLIVAGLGDDVVHGRGGDDIIIGDIPFAAHPGHDKLYGGPGRDFIDSYDGRRDVADGGSGHDRGNTDRHDRVRSIETRG